MIGAAQFDVTEVRRVGARCFRRQFHAQPGIPSSEANAKFGGAQILESIFRRQCFDGDIVDQEHDIDGVRPAVDGDQDIVVAFEIDFEMKIAGGEVLHGGLGWGGRDDSGGGDCFRGGEVFFHERRGERKHAGDVVEAVAGVINREIGRGLEGDGEEVAHGGVVFVAIEAAGVLGQEGNGERE